MRRTKKTNAVTLYLTLLYIASINPQPLASSKLSLKVNNEKKEVLSTMFTVANAIPNDAPTQVGISTHSPILHNIEAVKDETSTHNIQGSTSQSLIKDDPNQKIYFPGDSIPSKISIKNKYLSESTTYPPPTRNPNLKISLHSSNKVVTSTHLPIKHNTLKPVESSPTIPVADRFLSESSIHPPLTGNPNLGISRHPSNKVVSSTHPPLMRHTDHTLKPAEDSSILSVDDRFLPENSTYSPTTENPNLGASTHPSKKVVSSTFPPLIHSLDDTLDPVDDSSTVLIEDRFLSEDPTPPTGNLNLVISTHSSNKDVSSTFPPLIHNIDHTLDPVEDSSTVLIEDRFLSENSTYPPPTRNPNLGISTHPSNKVTGPVSIEDRFLSENSTYPPPTRNPNLGISTHPSNKVTGPVSIEDRFLAENSTYPPPTRNPNLGISTHPSNKVTGPTHPPQVLETKPGHGEHVKSGELDIQSASSTNSPLILNLEASSQLSLLGEIESTKRIELITMTAPTKGTTEANVVTTYPPPTRNPNLGISTHRPDKTNSSESSMSTPDVNGTLITDADDPSKLTDKFNIKKCSFAIVGCCSTMTASHVNCFELLGCPGQSRYKNLCEKDIIGNAIEIVKAYYETGM